MIEVLERAGFVEYHVNCYYYKHHPVAAKPGAVPQLHDPPASTTTHRARQHKDPNERFVILHGHELRVLDVCHSPCGRVLACSGAAGNSAASDAFCTTGVNSSCSGNAAGATCYGTAGVTDADGGNESGHSCVWNTQRSWCS